MLGRGLRLSPETGKKDCLVLDVVGNSSQGVVCTPTLFGLMSWDDIENATISDLRKRKADEDAANAVAPKQQEAILPTSLTYFDYSDPRQLVSALAACGDPPTTQISRNAWIECGDYRHVLSSHDGSYVRVERANVPGQPIWRGLYIQRNTLYGVTTDKSPYLAPRKIAMSDDFAHTVRACDTFLAEEITASGRMPKYLWRTAQWRQLPASTRAKDAVGRVLAGRGKNKLSVNINLDELTQGDVDVILTRARHGARSRLMKQAKIHNAFLKRFWAGPKTRRI